MYYDQKESGRRIAALRKRDGFTQEQLAEKLNISVNYLGKLETGNYGGSIDLLIEIKETFGVTLDYLILGIQQENEAAIKEVIKRKLLFLIEFLTKFVNEL